MAAKLHHIFRILGALIIGAPGFFCSGQSNPPYFNKLYKEGIATFNVIETQKGYGTIGVHDNPSTSGQTLCILEVDGNGDTIYLQVIDSVSYSFYPGSVGNLTRYPHGYAMAVRSNHPVYQDMLMLLDTNFRFKAFLNLTDTTIARYFSQIIYHKDFFYITGHNWTPYPDSLHRRVPLLLKVDTNGTVVGDYNYPSASYQPQKVVNRNGHQVIPAGDGGFFIAASRLVDYMPGVLTNDSLDLLIIKTDSTGNREWERVFGSPTMKDPTFRIIPYSDSSVIASVSYPTKNTLDYYPYNTANEHRLYEIYNDGRPFNLVKTLKPDQQYHGALGFIRLSNGNFCFFGISRTHKLDKNFYPEIFIGYTYVLNASLDSLNFQYHQTPNGHITDYCYLYDARPTLDGGIITGGYLSTSRSLLNNNQPGSHIWLMKLDSLGCDSAGCAVLGIPESPETAHDISIFPNPTTGVCYVHTGNLSFPVHISVYNTFGKKVSEQTVSSQQSLVNLKRQTPGVYYIKIDNAEVETSRKVLLLGE